MTVEAVLNSLATAAQALANSTNDRAVKASATSAAVLIALVARMLHGRTPDDAKKILEDLLVQGVQPITEAELSGQVAKVLEALKAGLPENDAPR